jgi:DNA-binding PadR family transcriptional regulator
MDPNLTLAAYIKLFVTEKAASTEPSFFAHELRKFVENNSGRYPAPGSVDRTLRKLRKEGQLNYEIANRAVSYYRALPVVKTQ